MDGGSTSGHGRQSNQNYRGSNISSTGNSSSVRMNNDPFNNARFRHNTNGNTKPKNENESTQEIKKKSFSNLKSLSLVTFFCS